MRSSTLLPVAAAIVLTASPRAHADPRRVPPIQLTYTRSAGAAACPDAGGLRSAVLKEMGYDPFDTSAERKLDVSLERRAGQYVITMEMRDEAGEVVWTDGLKSRESCRTLVEAAGLTLVIHIDPPQDPEPCPVCPAPAPSPAQAPPLPPPPPAPLPAAEVHEAPPPNREPPPVPETPPKPIVFRLGAAFRLDYATVPHVIPGIALSGGVRHDWWSGTVEARWDPPASLPFPDLRSRLTRITASAVACDHHAWFSQCLVAEVGGLQIVALESHAVVYAALGTRLATELPALHPGIFFQLGVDLLGTVLPNGVASISGLSGQVPRVTGGLSLGLVYTIEKR